jgi:hypothetical protein
MVQIGLKNDQNFHEMKNSLASVCIQLPCFSDIQPLLEQVCGDESGIISIFGPKPNRF